MPGKGSDICGIPAFASEVSLLHNRHGGIMKSHPELLDWPQHRLRFWGMGDASEKELGAVPKRCPAPSLGTTKYICSPKWHFMPGNHPDPADTRSSLTETGSPGSCMETDGCTSVHLSVCLSTTLHPAVAPRHLSAGVPPLGGGSVVEPRGFSFPLPWRTRAP